MPHFASVLPCRRFDVLDLVQTCLESHFVSRGLVHEDVAWRNIGLYKDGEAEQHAVVFDLGRVRRETNDDEDWVHRAMEKLKQDA